MEKAYFTKIRKELILALLSSETDIQIAVAWFTSKELFDQLIYLLKDGVKITLIIIDDFINNGEFGLDFQQFIDCGGKLFYGKAENPMHHKFCIIDNKILFTGSYNWTYYAENKNFENVVKFENNKDLIDSFYREFEKLISDLEIVKTTNKISFEEFEIQNLFSIRNYIAMDLTYKGKQLKKIEFVETARRFIENNELINKEYEILKISTPTLTTQKVSPLHAENKIITKFKKFTQNSIGIKCRMNGIKGKFSILIPKETECPCSFSHIYRTVNDNQTQMSIETFKGEDEIADKNVRLGKFLINDLPKKPNGEAGVEITIKINSNNDLIVIAKSVDTGNQMEANYYDKLLVVEKTSS
nr:phospholipase D-like domain-containing protein [uncultured Flavobacterium sp.]